MLEKEKKKKIVETFKTHPTDTGSPNVQIAIMTTRINHLSEEHFKKNTKDFASKRGLLKLVSKRRRLLNYLQKNNPKSYSMLIEKLEIRK